MENGKNFDLSNPENFEPVKSSNKIFRTTTILVLFAAFGFAIYWFYFRKSNSIDRAILA